MLQPDDAVVHNNNDDVDVDDNADAGTVALNLSIVDIENAANCISDLLGKDGSCCSAECSACMFAMLSAFSES